jgi:hypothetical protein
MPECLSGLGGKGNVRRVVSFGYRVLLLAAVAGVCAAQSMPEAAGTVVTLTGQVSVLHDSVPWALHEGSQVTPRQVIVTGPDGYALFKVSDGSTFEVFPNSRATFRDNPGNWKDMLELWIGRVKVHIQKLNGQPNHNKVRTPTAIISVRGTIFDVSVDDGDSTLVVVDEGQVAVEHRLLPSEPKLLNPGEWLRVTKNEPIARKGVDKTNVITAALRAAEEAIYTTLTRTPRAGGGGTATTGGGLPGDSGSKPTDPTTPSGDAGPGAPPPPAP